MDDIKPIQIKPNKGPGAAPSAPPQPPAGAKPPKKGLRGWWRGLSKRNKIIIITSASVIVLAAGAFLTWRLVFYKPKPKPQPAPAIVHKEPEKPKLVQDPLTGVMVSPEAAAQPVAAVILENLYPAARPQSGLSSAGVVYEALAEGGITRYEAFYQEPFPPDLGPVRSLRTYFAYWGVEYAVPVVHAGGNADALDLISPLGMKDLDALGGGTSRYFRRIGDRPSPHNLYINAPSLTNLVADNHYATAPAFAPWTYKDETKVTAAAINNITINFSYFDYQAKFTYNPAGNNYARFVRGAADVDANGGVQVTPKNIVVMTMPTSFGVTRIGEQTVIMGVVGSGKVQIFRDGGEIDGTWSKPDNTARTTFTDANGQPIPLNRGQTWVSVLPAGRSITAQ